MMKIFTCGCSHPTTKDASDPSSVKRASPPSITVSEEKKFLGRLCTTKGKRWEKEEVDGKSNKISATYPKIFLKIDLNKESKFT